MEVPHRCQLTVLACRLTPFGACERRVVDTPRSLWCDAHMSKRACCWVAASVIGAWAALASCTAEEPGGDDGHGGHGTTTSTSTGGSIGPGACTLVSSHDGTETCGWEWDCGGVTHRTDCAPNELLEITTCSCDPPNSIAFGFSEAGLCDRASSGLYPVEDVLYVADGECDWNLPTTGGGPERWACTLADSGVAPDACHWTWSCAVGTVTYQCDWDVTSRLHCECAKDGVVLSEGWSSYSDPKSENLCNRYLDGVYVLSNVEYFVEQGCGPFVGD
jgi:hypothetical protein